jgi:hypothetical protein
MNSKQIFVLIHVSCFQEENVNNIKLASTVTVSNENH